MNFILTIAADSFIGSFLYLETAKAVIQHPAFTTGIYSGFLYPYYERINIMKLYRFIKIDKLENYVKMLNERPYKINIPSLLIDAQFYVTPNEFHNCDLMIGQIIGLIDSMNNFPKDAIVIIRW